MRVTNKLFLLPLLGMMGLALIQPASAETFQCTQTTRTVTNYATPYMVDAVLEAPVLLEPSTVVTTTSPMTFERIVEQPVLIKEKLETPIMVERPVLIERNVMVSSPVIIKEKQAKHLFHLHVMPVGSVSVF